VPRWVGKHGQYVHVLLAILLLISFRLRVSQSLRSPFLLPFPVNCEEIKPALGVTSSRAVEVSGVIEGMGIGFIADFER